VTTHPPISTFLASVLAALLALGWLLPNHYAPWTTFHMDAWIASMLALVSVLVIARANVRLPLHGTTLLIAILITVPLWQHSIGLIPLSGSALVSAAYLLGFLVALIAGALWDSVWPGQVGDFLFLAIGTAALVSVGLELHQWLSLDVLGVWNIDVWGAVPFANFAQPNQLATFLLWGLLATAWGTVRHKICLWTALFMAAFLLFGLALTASRAGWVGVCILVAAGWVWRPIWPFRHLPWIVTALGLYFVVCVNSLVWLSQLLSVDLPTDVGTAIRIGGQTRLELWPVFVEAILQRPLLGYGWNHGGMAFMTAMANHPSLNLYFPTAHNLLLDLFVWCGIPMGLFLSIFLLRWLWTGLRKIRTPDSAVLMLVLLVVGNHAMFENPLYHGYFLLPAGLVMGAINVRLQGPPLFTTGRVPTALPWLASVVLLAMICWDYRRVEASYLDLRFEEAHIKTTGPRGPPDVLLLNQWSEFIYFARVNPFTLTSEEELERMRKVASTFPSKGLFFNFSIALALNDHPEEAELWLKRLCKNEPEAAWRGLRAYWAQLSLGNQRISNVPWPQ